MKLLRTTALSVVLMLSASGLAQQPASRPMVIVDEADTVRREPPPHGAIGSSTAYRISDAVPGRTMEFRKRILHPGSAIGLHRIAHDEVYYVVSGTGAVSSGGTTQPVQAGIAAYLFDGETVGIRQTGSKPLVLIIAYPIPR
ncbi:cupin domain-containing protein [Sphingomonas sp. PB2P12]|uniref:cupin domain-containing protein n=1 Tax=Sphingomonas sandaracina TaxID=3096157 RepID=UPI002FC8A326